jgi:hypothetical protein
MPVTSRLLTTLRAAMQELDHTRDWGTRRPIEPVDPRRRDQMDQTVEIKVNHVVVQGADINASRSPVALRRHVFIAPSTILDPDAASCRAAAFEPDALCPRSASRQWFGIRHFHRRHQINHLAHVLARQQKLEYTQCHTGGLPAADAQIYCPFWQTFPNSLGQRFPGHLFARGDLRGAAMRNVSADF